MLEAIVFFILGAGSMYFAKPSIDHHLGHVDRGFSCYLEPAIDDRFLLDSDQYMDLHEEFLLEEQDFEKLHHLEIDRI